MHVCIKVRLQNNKIQKIKPMSKHKSASATLQRMLSETPNHPRIKETLKLLTQTRQKITYHAIMSSSQTYLQLRGLANHDQQQFNYINKMLHSKIVGLVGRINRRQINVRNLEQQQRQQLQQQIKQQNVINQDIIAQVEHVLNNIDLPLSLFKRNDNYWYHDNPKTLQAQKYVQDRIRQDKERKNRIRSQMKKKQQQSLKYQRQRQQRQAKMQQENRRKHQQQIKNKIQYLKKQSQLRQKNIKQSQKYTNSLKPLYLKIKQEHEQSKNSALQEQKKRLSEIRKLHKSIDMSQIQQHHKKITQLQKQRQIKKIFNEPVNVSYKSKYHTSMTTRSRIGEYQTTRSLYDRKKEYGTLVKNEFKPHLDQKLIEQMQQRLKIMNRKRVRKNPKKKQQNTNENENEDSDEQYDQNQQKAQPPKQQPKKQSQPNKNIENSSEQDDSGSDDQNKKLPHRIRGQDEDPDRHQRYELGVGYLEYVRNLKKKKKQDSSEKQQLQDPGSQRNTRQAKQSKTSQRYKDYLREFVKTNRSTIDHINTSRIKDTYNKSIIGDAKKTYNDLSQLQNEARIIQNKVMREQQLLKHKKMKSEDANAKKVEIDNAVIQTIKARLALMGK